MPERAVRDAEEIGGFGLHTVGTVQSALQQSALDARHIDFHSHTLRKHCSRLDFGGASGSPGGGTSLAQNSTPPGATGQASEQRVTGEMTKQEARQLLDSLRDEQRQMPGNPVARGGNDNSSDQPFKDW